MCNLSEGIEERAMEAGRKAGIEEGRKTGLELGRNIFSNSKFRRNC